jgi:predicted metal-dependent hydrolase
MITSSRIIQIKDIGNILLEHSLRAKRLIITIRDEKIRVAVPKWISFHSAIEFVNQKEAWIRKILERNQKKRVQKVLSNKYLAIDNSEAKRILTTKLQFFSKRYGFKYNAVSFRYQKTRWGSCSSNNNISLNLKLLALPEDLIDYVLIHELVHTKVHNHSKQFWDELNKYVINAKKISSRLRRYELD